MPRAELIKRIEAQYRLDRSEASAFVASGARVRVRRGIDQDAAMKTLLDLQQLGAVVELEPNRPPPAALANLDEFAGDTQPPAIDLPLQPAFDPDALKGALVSLDGGDDRPVDSQALTVVEHVPESSTDPIPAAPPRGDEPSLQLPITVEDDDRFRAPSHRDQQIELDAPRPDPKAAAASEEEAPPPQMCEDHELPEPCAECARENAPVPGRLLQGALRRQPLVRVFAGVALGLLVGWLVSLPYANRAERRVADVRAEANVDRYKNDPELRANAARLDARAEAMSNRAAFVTIAIWLLVGGGVVGAWYRVT